MEVTIKTDAFKKLGYQTAKILFMYNAETQMAQDATKEFEKYKKQVLNPKSQIQFECAKAFILGGNEFIQDFK